MVIRVEKMTVSLRPDLIKLTDAVAKERKTSRSKVVSSCLEELADTRFRESMAEGYKRMAKESLAFATGTSDMAKNTLPEWEQ